MSGASVLHFRYGSDPARPWAGISPLGFAYLTGKLAGGLELRLSQEAQARVGYLLPVPGDGGDGSDDDPHKRLKADLAALAGNTSLIETTAAGWGEGKVAGASNRLEASKNRSITAGFSGLASLRCCSRDNGRLRGSPGSGRPPG